MLTERQSANARNDRQEINKARQAAEDLFKPRQQTSGPDVPVSSAEHLPRRQPRILMARQPGPTVVAVVKAPREPKSAPRRVAIRREGSGIPAGQFGRIRALASYGMSQAQVAELYGVTVDEIDRVIRRPD